MLLDIVAGLLGTQVTGLLGSQLLRAVAFDVATSLLCQVIQHTATTAARPRSSARATQSDAGPAQTDSTSAAPGTPTPNARPSAAAPRTPTPTAHATNEPSVRALPPVEIISSVPGRVRVRAPGVRGDAARAAEVSATVRALAGVTSAQASARTGTLLVHYDPDETSVGTIVAALETPVSARPRAAQSVPYLRLVVG
jgi:hypothetical protein